MLVGGTESMDTAVGLLRTVDWSMTFDAVVDACTRERHAYWSAATADVLLVDGTALRALARYQVGLTLRGDEFDPSIRGWLEGPAMAAAARYDAVIHVRSSAGAPRGECLVDEALAAVLDRMGRPCGAFAVTPLRSDIRHTIGVVLDSLGLGPNGDLVWLPSANRIAIQAGQRAPKGW